MKDQRLRDMMTDLYRIVERYETLPDVSNRLDIIAFFDNALMDCQGLWNKYTPNKFAERFAVAVFEALDDTYAQKVGRKS